MKSGTQEKYAGWVKVPTGFVGVVTNLAENKARGTLPGIQNKVLQPGLYPVNPKEEQVDMIGVGFNVTSVNSKFKTGATTASSARRERRADHRRRR